jgi:hypothetical protein
MKKVTVQEIIDAFEAYGKALEDIGYERTSDPALPERIQQHGIEASYTPMSDDEIEDLLGLLEQLDLDDLTAEIKLIEQAVLNRLGVAPTPPLAEDILALIEYMDGDPLQGKNALITQGEWQTIKSALTAKYTPTEIGDAVQEAELQDDHTQAATLAEARERELESHIAKHTQEWLDARSHVRELIEAGGETRDELHDLRVDYRQLQVRQTNMIAELRGLVEYEADSNEAFPIYAESMLEVINKYEALK